MGFVVDKVSEDSFYENLLLGVSKVLEKSPYVSNLLLKRISGIRQIDIRSWEHNNGVILPEDLRAFFSSTNGFLYTYDFSYDYTTTDDSRVVRQGKIEINSLDELIRIYGYETKNVGQIEQVGNKFKLSLSRDSKIFELGTIDENAKVVLVYVNSYSVPSIWLYSTPMAFHHLADDFTTYFRMYIAHLGIPCWQYIFAKEGLPEWSREMFHILAPGVLPEDRNLVEVPRLNFSDVNKIDPNIFVSPSNSHTSVKNNNTIQSTQQSKVKDKKIKSLPKKSTNKVVKKPINLITGEIKLQT